MFVSKMSGVEYVEFTLRKYATALAICLIKCKPKNMNIKDFCIDVQLKYIAYINLQFNDIEEKKQDETAADFTLTDNNGNSLYSKSVNKKVTDLNDSTKCNNVNEMKLHMKIIHALRCVNNAICGFKGQCSIYYNEAIKNEVNKYFSQQSFTDFENESTSQLNKPALNERTKVEKKLTLLNTSILTLLNFILNVSNYHMFENIFHHVANILGEIIDTLYEKNVSLSCVDELIRSSENFIQDIINNPNINQLPQKHLDILFALNKSFIVTKSTLSILEDNLELFLGTLSSYKKEEVMELLEINHIHKLFFVFKILKSFMENYQTYNVSTEELNENATNVNCEIESENKKTYQNVTQNWFLSQENKANLKEDGHSFIKIINQTLSGVVIQCIETYPLISFSAMEIINIINKVLNKHP